MTKEIFKESPKYKCGCAGTITIFVDTDPNAAGSVGMVNVDGGQVRAAWTAECDNKDCPFNLAVLNIGGWPAPALTMFSPLDPIENESNIISVTKDGKIVDKDGRKFL